jgi:hypothetical protein
VQGFIGHSRLTAAEFFGMYAIPWRPWISFYIDFVSLQASFWPLALLLRVNKFFIDILRLYFRRIVMPL